MRSNVERLAELKIAEVAKAIGVPVEKWSGNCYAIACSMLRAKLLKGRPAYGHWVGDVHPRSPFYSKTSPFQRHGWVVVEERGPHAERPGLVVDPTRWVFEAVEPYIYVGRPNDVDDPDCEDCGYKEYEHDEDDDSPTCGGFAPPRWPYDEGGDQFRTSNQTPMPDYQTGEKTHHLRVPLRIKRRLGLPHKLTDRQMFWVANLPYVVMGRDAWAICQALSAAGHKGYVPLDTFARADAERGL